MPEVLGAALATPGLLWMIVTTLVAGAVYGFAGFGAALIFMPVATAFVSPQLAISCLAITAIGSIATVVPRAWARCDKPAALSMIGVAALTIPLGVLVLRVADPLVLRWGVIAMATITWLALILGWRRQSADSTRARLSVAGAAGLAGGAIGLNGPILVLFHLSGQGRADEIRANTIVFLSITGFLVLPIMAVQGLIGAEAIALGLLLLVPYGLGTLAGQRLFVPGQEVLYRRAALAIIAAAIVLGLPIWA